MRQDSWADMHRDREGGDSAGKRMERVGRLAESERNEEFVGPRSGQPLWVRHGNKRGESWVETEDREGSEGPNTGTRRAGLERRTKTEKEKGAGASWFFPPQMYNRGIVGCTVMSLMCADLFFRASPS
jgi:hypothetical protein